MIQLSTIKPALWGGVIGALAVTVVGFSWGGWVTGESARQRANGAAEAAVVAALVPLCVDKFKQGADAATMLVALRNTNSWQRGSFVENGGWASPPGGAAPIPAVVTACAEALAKTTS